MVSQKGFEPLTLALEGRCSILLSYWHTNPFGLAGVAGFEPTNARVKVSCLTAWRHPNNTVCQFVCPHRQIANDPSKTQEQSKPKLSTPNCKSTHTKKQAPPATKRAGCLERVMGIEPTRPAWKAGILPLNYTRMHLQSIEILSHQQTLVN